MMHNAIAVEATNNVTACPDFWIQTKTEIKKEKKYSFLTMMAQEKRKLFIVMMTENKNGFQV